VFGFQWYFEEVAQNASKRKTMTPEQHTIYSLSLFFALASLLLWSKRRHRVSQHIRSRNL